MTRTKRIDLWQSIVDGIVTDYRRLDNACDAALKAGAMDPSGPLHDAIWRSFSGMLDRIDVDDWITWFIYENECGKKAREAKGCGKRGMTPIKTTRHLARLIVESEEHSGENVKADPRMTWRRGSIARMMVELDSRDCSTAGHALVSSVVFCICRSCGYHGISAIRPLLRVTRARRRCSSISNGMRHLLGSSPFKVERCFLPPGDVTSNCTV